MADILSNITNILLVIACLKYIGFFKAVAQIAYGDEEEEYLEDDANPRYYGPYNGSAVELADMVDVVKEEDLFVADNYNSSYGVYGMNVLDGELGDMAEAGVEE